MNLHRGAADPGALPGSFDLHIFHNYSWFDLFVVISE